VPLRLTDAESSTSRSSSATPRLRSPSTPTPVDDPSIARRPNWSPDGSSPPAADTALPTCRVRDVYRSVYRSSPTRLSAKPGERWRPLNLQVRGLQQWWAILGSNQRPLRCEVGGMHPGCPRRS